MIRAQAKRLVRTLYAMRCGYCGISEREIGAELTFDHFRPKRHGGNDEAVNLVYCCHACNEFKGDYWSEDDATRFLHPLVDNLTEHFHEEADGTLTTLTERGRIYCDQLQLNRPPLIVHRLENQRISQAIEERQDLQHTLDAILSRLENIEAQLRRS